MNPAKSEYPTCRVTFFWVLRGKKMNQVKLLSGPAGATTANDEIVGLVERGEATQSDADSLALSIVGSLMSVLALTGMADPSKMSALDARTYLDASDQIRMHARFCLPIFKKHYPSSAKVLENALTVGLFAEALITPALLLGNIDAMDRKLSSVNTYIIKSPESGLIKIGKSKTPNARIRSLETGAGCRLEVLAIIDKDIESKLHKKFSDLRAFGEWFLDDGRIASYAKGVTT